MIRKFCAFALLLVSFAQGVMVTVDFGSGPQSVNAIDVNSLNNYIQTHYASNNNGNNVPMAITVAPNSPRGPGQRSVPLKFGINNRLFTSIEFGRLAQGDNITVI